MTEEEKRAFRNSFSGKKVSEMIPEERELFNKEFQYGFSNVPNSKPNSKKSKQLPKHRSLTMGFPSQMNLIVKK